MKKINSLLLMFLCFFNFYTAYGQITAISPNGAVAGQEVAVTITSNGNPQFNSSNTSVTLVLFQMGTDTFTANLDSIYGTTATTISLPVRVRPSQAPGIYNLIVRSSIVGLTIFDTLYSAFTIGNGGTVSGIVFKDINRNGLLDAGEPGIPSFPVSLNNGTFCLTNAIGAYSFYTPVGVDTIKLDTLTVDNIYNATTPLFSVVSISPGTNVGPNFGLFPSKFLVSATSNVDTAGTTFTLTITDSNVTTNSTLVNVGLSYAGRVYYADSISIFDNAHIKATFYSTDALQYAPYGRYQLGVAVQNNTYHDIRSYTLDTALTIIGPTGFISGYAYLDQNQNGIFDSGELPLAGYNIYCNGNYISTDHNGYYRLSGLIDGAYVLNGDQDPGHFFGNCFATTQIVEPAIGYNLTINHDSVIDRNFGYYYGALNTQDYDLFIHPGWNYANPGFNKHYWIWYGNHSNVPAANGTITFQYDSILTYVSCDRTPTTIDVINHVITWNVDSIYPTPNYNQSIGYAPGWYGGWDNFNLYMLVSASASPGTFIHDIFSVSPTQNDCDLSDNSWDDNTPITSSHDPNSKEANPYSINLIGVDSSIEYTINFQNTGTASTHFIIVTDTLDPNLDARTVEVTNSSLPYILTNNNGVLTFTFNPGALPDSALSPEGSIGAVSFEVRLKPNQQVGTVIHNTANVYFDYNKPVITNTTNNTISNPLAVKNIAGDNNKVIVRPNPFSDGTTITFTNTSNDSYSLSVYDLLGNEVKTITTTGSEFDIVSPKLTAGVYVFKLTDQNTNQSTTGKLIAQ